MGAEQKQLLKIAFFFFAGVFLFTLVLLFSVGSLVGSHCAANSEYYGCDTQN